VKTSKLGAEAVQNHAGGTVTVTFPRLGNSNAIKHAVTTRVGGVSRGIHQSMNLSFKVGDDSVNIEENRTLLSKVVGMDLNRIGYVNQVHSDRVLKLDANFTPENGSLGEADGIISNEKNIPIMIMVADCLPVMFYDPIHKAIGLAHAGWRGTVSHVAVKTLLAMGEAYGTKAAEVRAVLGPCIGACCYEVGKDVEKEFTNLFPWGNEVLEKSGKEHWKLDVSEANARQLLEIGVRDENLIRSRLCTIQNIDLFYSYRAEASPEKPTGRFGVLMMVNS